MRNNETGEFELVVGNRQIMSGFFIVVLLFAVGVAMGYFLGQNSPKSAKLAAEAPATSAAVTAVDTRPQAAAPVPATQQTPPAESAQPPATPVETAPQPSTQPVREAATPAPVTASTAAASSSPAPPPEAPAGTYWQVMAVGRADADVVARTLQNKGFPALISPGTKGLTRVLVGPYADRPALGRAKGDLEAAGFTSLIRYASDQERK
jgi:cell division protein FtsN